MDLVSTIVEFVTVSKEVRAMPVFLVALASSSKKVRPPGRETGEDFHFRLNLGLQASQDVLPESIYFVSGKLCLRNAWDHALSASDMASGWFCSGGGSWSAMLNLFVWSLCCTSFSS